MRKLSTEELKQKLLEILVVVDDFCAKNNIRYSLEGGTLLGAVRHKGFIPWDDDIDLMMPRPDYDKFVRSFNGGSNHYRVECYETNKNMFFNFAKVIDTRTKLFEYGGDTGLGINIDIFQIDGFDLRENIYKTRKKLRLLRGLMMAKQYGAKLSRKNIVMDIVKGLLAPVPMRLLSGMCQKLIRTHNYEKSRSVCLMTTYNVEKLVFPRRLFNDYIQIEFEERKFYAVRNYDIYLTNEYGDYMRLPPPHEREPKHSAIGYVYE
jgi:lipopolysaccharide cholinephosphotransferase